MLFNTFLSLAISVHYVRVNPILLPTSSPTHVPSNRDSIFGPPGNTRNTSMTSNDINCFPSATHSPPDRRVCGAILHFISQQPHFGAVQGFSMHRNPQIDPRNPRSVPPFLFHPPGATRNCVVGVRAAHDRGGLDDFFSWEQVAFAVLATIGWCVNPPAGHSSGGWVRIGRDGGWIVRVASSMQDDPQEQRSLN